MKEPKKKLKLAIELDAISLILAGVISILGMYLILQDVPYIWRQLPSFIFRLVTNISIVTLLTKDYKYAIPIKVFFTGFYLLNAILLFRLAYFTRYITEYSPELRDHIIVGYSPALLIHSVSGLAMLVHVFCSARLVYLCWKNEGVREYIKEQNGKQ